MKADCYVYGLFRPDKPCIFYIGMGKGQRAWQHERDRRRGRSYKDNLICRIIDDLGYPEIPVVIIREGLTKAEAILLEIALIHAIGRRPHGPLTNIAKGGEGLADPTDEFRQRHSIAMRSALSDPDIRKVMSDKAKARDRTGAWEQKRLDRMQDPDVREKMSNSAKLRVRDLEVEARRMAAVLRPEAIEARAAKLRGRVSPWKGKSPSPDSRAKMRAAKLGKPSKTKGRPGNPNNGLMARNWANPEVRAKMCAKRLGRVWITNGVECHTIESTETVPEGWRKGRIFKSASTPTNSAPS